MSLLNIHPHNALQIWSFGAALSKALSPPPSGLYIDGISTRSSKRPQSVCLERKSTLSGSIILSLPLHREREREMAGEREEDEDDMVCLDESFFINDNYQLTKFTFGSQVLELYCLQSASTDFDLTGQLVWPGAMLLNEYLSKNVDLLLNGCSAIELGSGVGITGMLCRKFCRDVVLTDHSNEVLKILKKNIELHSNDSHCSGLVAEKLEWGNSDQVNNILETHQRGFDLILGADICFQQASVPLLFDTVKHLLQRSQSSGRCKFILAYVSRAKSMDSLVIKEAVGHGMQIHEIPGTRSVVGNLEGWIYEVIDPLA